MRHLKLQPENNSSLLGYTFKKKLRTHSPVISSDEKFIRLAIREAIKAQGMTAPNPIVGAVIVKNNHVIARGYHARAGEAHAEIAAINNLPSPADAHGATLYVTLEPCSTFGKTGPCTAAIIEAGFARVVYGATDPNPAHQGQALAILKNAGIEVTTGILEKECTTLNASWNHRMKTGMPWIIAKCGMSLDACLIVQSGPRWITSARSRRDAMYLRAEVDSILVGGATVRTDNPALTIRGIKVKENHPQPWRIVWTKSGKILKECKLLSDEHRDRTIIMQDLPLGEALKNLATRGISSVMIEGGGQTLREAFRNNLVDEVRFYVAPQLLGGPSWIEKTNSANGVSHQFSNFLESKTTSKKNRKLMTDPICENQAMIDKIAALIAPLNLSNIAYRAIGKDVVVSALVKKTATI